MTSVGRGPLQTQGRADTAVALIKGVVWGRRTEGFRYKQEISKLGWLTGHWGAGRERNTPRKMPAFAAGQPDVQEAAVGWRFGGDD